MIYKKNFYDDFYTCKISGVMGYLVPMHTEQTSGRGRTGNKRVPFRLR